MKKSGFTLLEISVAVVIVGILAGMAVPTYRLASIKAKRTEAKLLLRNFWQAEDAYFAQNGEYYPSARGGFRGWRWGHIYIPAGRAKDIPELGLKIPENHRYSLYFYWDLSPWGTTFIYCVAFTPRGKWDIDGDPFWDMWAVTRDGIIYCVADDITNHWNGFRL